MGDPAERRSRVASPWLGVVLGAGTILFALAGITAAVVLLGPEKGGYLTGQVLVFALFGLLVLGALFSSLHVPHHWLAAASVAACGFMVAEGLIASVQVRAMEQEKAALSELHDLLTQMAKGQQIVPKDYLVSDYGAMSYVLTAASHDAAEGQRKQLALQAREKAIQLVDISSPVTLTDHALRQQVLRQLAELQSIYVDSSTNIRLMQDKMKQDVMASAMPEADKQGFLTGFDRSKQGSSLDEFYKTLLELVTEEREVVELAEADQPRLIGGRCIFNSTETLKTVQTDIRKIGDLVAQVKTLRQKLSAEGQSAINSLH